MDIGKYVIIAGGIAPTIFPNGNIELEKKILGDLVKVVLIDQVGVDMIIEPAKNTLGIIYRPGAHINMNQDFINRLRNCKAIVSLAVGFDDVDIVAAGNKGIPVINVPDYGIEDVAKSAMGMILSFLRGTYYYSQKIFYTTDFWDYSQGLNIRRLDNVKLGIIGLGRIGSALAYRAKAFGMKIYFYDPYLPTGTEKILQIKRMENVEELLSISDVVSIHTPLTNETKGMINKKFIYQMKSQAILINTARGLIFESFDVIDWALNNNQIFAIGTDVLPEEPPYSNKVFQKIKSHYKEKYQGRLIITPHAAFYSEVSDMYRRNKAAIAMKNILEGREVRDIVNIEYLKKG